jgi:RluA family pseudouridine synthase
MKNNFNILYEDTHIIAIDKPSGIPVIPERWDKIKLNLYEYLNNYYKPSKKIFIVHRIDRDCSGVILFAKSKEAHRSLCIQFENKKVQKQYIAIVEGLVSEKSATIDLPIAQRKKGPIRSIIKETGKPSQTYYEVLESFKFHSLLSIIPYTGRPNQIRLHLSAIGHPILLDPLYNKKSSKLINENGNLIISRLALHAHKISFSHPITNVIMELEAPTPSDMLNAISFLRNLK